MHRNIQLDISQKKLYEKLITLEKYCIKLEKRITVVENENKKLKQLPNPLTKQTIINKTPIIPNSNRSQKIPTKSIINKTSSGEKKVKKIFDKYNMKPINI